MYTDSKNALIDGVINYAFIYSLKELQTVGVIYLILSQYFNLIQKKRATKQSILQDI